MKALVVDDSSATRFIISRMLREIGCSVVEAENGEVALEVLGQNQDATFALVDWNMPVMNGFDLVQAIRQQSSYDDVKVMMVTTETEMTQVVKAIEAGANEYLMKPFTKEMLLDKIALLGIEVPVETE
ncbi:MAG: response regulator [Bdellovibrionota bacterium]|jgi:two-component system chemotaxis response regulator CheY